MADEENRDQGNIGGGGIGDLAGQNWIVHIVRLIVSAVVLMVVSYITPGFTGLTFWHAILAAILIAVLGYAAEALFGPKITPYARGGVGFVVSAVIFYLIQFMIPGVRISILGALIAAAIVGIIDMFVPTTLR